MDGSWLVVLLEVSGSCRWEVSHGWKLLLSGWPVTCKKEFPVMDISQLALLLTILMGRPRTECNNEAKLVQPGRFLWVGLQAGGQESAGLLMPWLVCLCCLFSCKSGGCAKWTAFRNQAGFSMFTLFSCIWEIIAGVWTSTYFLNMLWSTYAKLLFWFLFWL